MDVRNDKLPSYWVNKVDVRTDTLTCCWANNVGGKPDKQRSYWTNIVSGIPTSYACVKPLDRANKVRVRPEKLSSYPDQRTDQHTEVKMKQKGQDTIPALSRRVTTGTCPVIAAGKRFLKISMETKQISSQQKKKRNISIW